MTESTASPTSSRATPRATLAALGVKLRDLITTVPLEELFRWTGTKAEQTGDPHAELLAIAHSYDQRGGGCETSFQGDKQGLGKRNKKRFEAQQMLVQLGALAHNVFLLC
jgi:hypothetical protein